MTHEIDTHETARRVRAAMAYANMSRDVAAEILGVSIATLNRITTTRGEPRRVDLRDLWRLADACALPREWFSADFDLLHRAVVDGPTFMRPDDPRAELEDELEARVQADRRARQRAGTDAPSAGDPRRRRGRAR